MLLKTDNDSRTPIRGGFAVFPSSSPLSPCSLQVKAAWILNPSCRPRGRVSPLCLQMQGDASSQGASPVPAQPGVHQLRCWWKGFFLLHTWLRFLFLSLKELSFWHLSSQLSSGPVLGAGDTETRELHRLHTFRLYKQFLLDNILNVQICFYALFTSTSELEHPSGKLGHISTIHIVWVLDI